MSLKSILLVLASVVFLSTAQAQVKVGANPGSITSGAVLDVEGASGRSVVRQNGAMGINTTSPDASADLELGSTNKALFLNRVANTAAVANPKPGMVIYDLSENCVKVYQGSPATWSGCLLGASAVGTVSALSCGSASFSPSSATQGSAYSGTLSVPYTGGNGGTYAAQSFSQNGLTFSLPAGSFATGAGSLSYAISGTPGNAGPMSVSLSAGGQSCASGSIPALSVSSNSAGIVPSSITLAQNQRYWVASVYDTDYLPYSAPASGATASTAVVNADGSAEAKTVNVQGSITTTGITVQIAATATGSGTVGAWTSIVVVPAIYAEDGISRTLELSWASQSYTSSSRYITATIRSLGGAFNAKKLDINAGIGGDYLGLLLGAFQYPYNTAGTMTGYEVRDIPGIPDRKFGQLDNTPSAGQRHNFLYLPVQNTNGQVWLNNNLGADYANLNNASFDLTQQATSIADRKAFGSMFQYGRNSDGHELMNWNSSGESYGLNSAVFGRVNTVAPTHSNLIYIANNGSELSDWNNLKDNTLWQGEAGVNNPCPYGFKVPTQNDFIDMMNQLGITTSSQAYSSSLKFTATGSRYAGGQSNTSHTVNRTTYSGDSNGGIQYRTSTPSSDGYVYRFENSGGYGSGVSASDIGFRISAIAVRCIKE